MSITVHIERLVLDGLDLDARQGSRMAASVEQALTRLLAADHALPSFEGARAVAAVDGGAIEVGDRATPGDVGGRIAGAVHHGLGARP